MKRVLAMLLLCSCKGGAFGTFFSSDVSEPNYAEDADTNLARGDEALGSKNYVEAQKYFDYVKSKYPYLEVATVAELKLGDVDFEREKYVEARDRYSNFVKLHPTHPKLDYAAFRAAYTHYKDMPSDLFFLPSSAEKDQGEVRAASVALADFIRSYPSSEYQEQAQKALDEVRRRMARHELYVAGFYSNRKKWNAVVARLNNVAREFGGLGYEEEVYFGLYDAHMNLKEPEKAEASLRELVSKYPDSKAAKRAERVLAKK